MKRLIQLFTAGAVGVLLVSGSASATKPAATGERHDGSATIRSASGDLLFHDGKGTYSHPHGSAWAWDSYTTSSEDLFALYVGNRRAFSLKFGSPTQTHECTGISHLFFEAPNWWGQTESVGDVERGSIGIWCEKSDGTVYAVRYPGYPRNPATAGEDCILVERLGHDVAGERKYQFRTPLSASLLPLPDACQAKVFNVVDTRSGRTSTLVWEGSAPLLVEATLR